ncbi:MAG: RNA polymerase sigma factor RpoD/SigA [Methanobrevibacter sp.]|nr:RNA polymerase sigma factor RpoD/SigA [Methanobrevibacter sp.]
MYYDDDYDNDVVGTAEVLSSTDDTIPFLMVDVSMYPLLTQDETIALLKAKDTDPEAKDRLVCSNMRLVISAAKDMYNRVSKAGGLNVQIEDLIQEGSMGLMTAIDKFDIEKDVKLATYAMHWIKNAMQRFVVNYGRTIRIPANQVEAMLFVGAASKELEAVLSRTPTASELSEYLNHKFTEKEISTLRRLMEDNTPLSWETPINGDGEEDYCLEDTLEDPGASTEDAAKKDMIKERIDMEINKFSPREKLIIRSVYGLGGSRKTLEETADILHEQGFNNPKGKRLSRESVRKICKKCMDKLTMRMQRHIKEVIK